MKTKLLLFILLIGTALSAQKNYWTADYFRFIKTTNKVSATQERAMKLTYNLRNSAAVELSFNFISQEEEGLLLTDHYLLCDDEKIALEKSTTEQEEKWIIPQGTSTEVFTSKDNTRSGTSIQVNPDGTHTVINHHGNNSVAVNPDGTHTVIHHHGNNSIAVNPDGTHTVIHHHGNNSIAVNPDGSHTVIHHHGNNDVAVNPDGTHAVIHQSGNNTVVTDPGVDEQVNEQLIIQNELKITLTSRELAKLLAAKKVGFIIKLENQELWVQLTRFDIKRLKRNLK